MAQLAAIGIVTQDIAESCRFYRTLGVDVPQPPAEGDHFDVELPNGLRLMWDTETLIKQLDPEWQRSEGHAIALAFQCTDAADVDATYARLLEAGFRGKQEP
jgi:catechol 2,3-dioxygenase-like lactoylglutathione lyase family enzyme